MATPETSQRIPIVITGMGLATSLGLDVDSTWAGVRAGKIGLGPLSAMESPLPEGAIGGQAVELPESYCPELPREARYLRWVIEQALVAANLKSEDASRRSTILGTTLHGLRAGGRFLRTNDPGELQHFLSNSILHLATRGLGLEGSAITTCSACSSSLGAIALGVTMLETGTADLVVAGGYDAVSEYAWGGFNSLRLVAPRAVMPFAKGRQGMMLGEGYAVVVLERAADAQRRGARALAGIDGWGESADAHHLTQPSPDGSGAARAIRDALDRAGVPTDRASSGDISMIAAHATATPDNDAAEAAAFRAVFQDSLAHTPVVGFKSYLGHTLGGAGAVELLLSACALRSGWIPPCATTRQEDVEFEGLRVAPPGGVSGHLKRTLNTSLGFGGANTCVILGHAPTPGTRAAPAVHASRPAEPEAWITGYGVVLPGVLSIEDWHAARGTVESFSRSQAGPITDEQLGKVMNVRRVRRLGTCVKLMLASVSLALKHAGLEEDSENRSRACALLASTHGSSGFCSEYYSQIVAEGVLNANPVLFAEGVPNAAAAHVSTNFGVRGACQTFVGSRNAGLDALSMAALRIRSGAAETVLVGAAEETHARVDDAYRYFLQGSNVQESATDSPFFTAPGSVSLIVESSVTAQARGVRPIARIGPCASISPGSSLSAAPQRSCNGEFDTPSRVLQRLAQPGVPAGPVLTSGNGTWIDRAEANAIRRIAGATLIRATHAHAGDLFSAGPLLDIVSALATTQMDRFTALCTDFTGPASGVVIERMMT